MRKIVLLIVVILNFYNLKSQINNYKGNFINDIGVKMGRAIFEYCETLIISVGGITFISKNIGVLIGITFLGDEDDGKVSRWMGIMGVGITYQF